MFYLPDHNSNTVFTPKVKRFILSGVSNFSAVSLSINLE